MNHRLAHTQLRLDPPSGGDIADYTVDSPNTDQQILAAVKPLMTNPVYSWNLAPLPVPGTSEYTLDTDQRLTCPDDDGGRPLITADTDGQP